MDVVEADENDDVFEGKGCDDGVVVMMSFLVS